MPLNFLTQRPSTTITHSTQNILLDAVIALLKYVSLKMCHITDPQAHYGAPCSQLSEPPRLEATVTKRGSHADLGSALSSSHLYLPYEKPTGN